MSKLIHIKALVISNLDTSTEVKRAVLDIINCIDSDIDDAGGFDGNDEETDLAIARLDRALIGEIEDEGSQAADAETNEQEDDDPLEGFNENKDKDG